MGWGRQPVGRAAQHGQRRVYDAGGQLCRSARHRPVDHGARRRTAVYGRRGLRKAGLGPPAQCIGIHGQHRAGLHFAEDHAADRPSAGRGLRVHQRWADLSGGRIRLRPYRRERSALCQGSQEHQQQSAAVQLAADDEERILSGLERGTDQVPAGHQVPERYRRRLSDVYPRTAGEGRHPVARAGM